jgi:N-ethylmaleimide reductase
MSETLFSPYNTGSYIFSNRMVMAPMTRSRAMGNLPNELMAEYYSQRAGAGLIITEGVPPSANGSGYARIPGIYSQEQITQWKQTTQAVHEKGGHIFLQIMHTGRIGHPDNLPVGGRMLAPSAIQAAGDMYTDKSGMQPYAMPSAFTNEEIYEAIQEHIQAARNAVEAGFDGVELHGAHGYLIEQFLNPHTNTRTDEFGGSMENRSRFALAVAAGIADAIGSHKVGIRFSPFNLFNDQQPYEEDLVNETYRRLAESLNELGIAYIHMSLNERISDKLLQDIRSRFDQTLIFCNGQNVDTASQLLENGLADLVAFGSLFLANPDLVKRFQYNLPLNQPDPQTFFTPFKEGLIDYPFSGQNN